jgi:hypothetical protein
LSPCFEDYVNLEHMLNNHCWQVSTAMLTV